MIAIITVLHIIVSIGLVLVVLLQTGKGADMGAVFGGSSSTIFGSSGAGNFLTRLTTGMAIVFMVTSLTLGYFSGKQVTSSVFDSRTPVTGQPAQQTATPPAQVQPQSPEAQPQAPESHKPRPPAAGGGKQ